MRSAPENDRLGERPGARIRPSRAEGRKESPPRTLGGSRDELEGLHRLCREGRLYEVERWIADGKPLQLRPEAVAKGTGPKSALRIALESGQHSLARLLLQNGYRLDLERYGVLDLALQSRRWDLFDLLLAWGADPKTVDVYTVLNTYNLELYERFRAAGYDLTERHEMAAILGHGTSNRPLFGFVKRHRTEDPKLQRELNIALGYQVRKGNERGISLCLWAGADPHAPAPHPEFGIGADPDPEDSEDRFIGWSAIEEAADHGDLGILKRLGPDPARDDCDSLYQRARTGSIVAFLATLQRPRDLTGILSWHLLWLDDRFPGTGYRSAEAIEAILGCGVRWDEGDRGKLARIRRSFLKVRDYELRKILVKLERPEICAPATYHELLRTPRMQQRLRALGIAKKPVTDHERQQLERRRHADEVARLQRRYDRTALYEQVWSRPVLEVAKAYGVSGVRLGKVCHMLQVPVPPRGYWARLRSGQKVRKPALPRLK